MTESSRSAPKILVVEDENVVALDIQRDLIGFGYEVTAVAASGEEAIEQAAALHPDLVLMDIRLRGEMDGVEAVDEIRTRFNIPSIYLTAYADAGTIDRARLTGAFGYLIKPFEERELHAAVEVALYRHQLEQRVRDSEQWLAATLAAIADAVIATDAQGRIRSMNPVAEALTGWPAGEAAGRQVAEVLSVKYSLPPDEAVRQRLAQANVAMEGVLISRQGIEIPVEERTTAIHDDLGRVVGMVMAIRDITERRGAEAEREQLLAQLARSNTELRQLASVAARDLREPLRKLGAAGKRSGRQPAATNLDQPNLERLRNSAGRLSSIVSGLLQYSELSSSKGKLRRVDLGRLVREVVAEMDVRILETGAALDIGPLPAIEADPRQMRQMLIHILDNALKFRRLGRPLLIRMRATFPKRKVRGAAAQVCELHVEDNGVGFDRKLAHKLFQPFQRLHGDPYGGIGMGLAICRAIVERHGGRITASGSPNKGAHLRIILPLAKAGVERTGPGK
jgi:PAS domain S-box-containing protein